MSEITKQKGASSSTPSPFMRWLTSKLMNYISSEKRQTKLRNKREAKRIKEGRKHVVEYFHQVDDGYSHLAIQTLSKLKAQYDIKLVVHLVPPASDDNFPEPELWKQMSVADAKRIAPFYGLEFDSQNTPPEQSLIQMAAAIFCNLNSEEVIDIGAEISAYLWRGDKEALARLAQQYGSASLDELHAKYELATARRSELKHYNPAMFYYEGEWYWGVDRLYHLENRLNALGATTKRKVQLIAPRPEVASQFGENASKLTLEFFVSLRSPYTAIAWDPTIKFAKQSGINLVVKPVLPMVMRGVPATKEKKIYIATDVAREARALNVEYGNFYDPIGEPVLRGYSLYMWALTQNKGNDLLCAFLKAAFARGVNCNKHQGIQQVAENAGLDWREARLHLHDDNWQQLLEDNRLSMYEFGSWGVPSYRLLDQNENEVLAVWGQDRLWLVVQKVKELSEQPDRYH